MAWRAPKPAELVVNQGEAIVGRRVRIEGVIVHFARATLTSPATHIIELRDTSTIRVQLHAQASDRGSYASSARELLLPWEIWDDFSEEYEQRDVHVFGLTTRSSKNVRDLEKLISEKDALLRKAERDLDESRCKNRHLQDQLRRAEQTTRIREPQPEEPNLTALRNSATEGRRILETVVTKKPQRVGSFREKRAEKFVDVCTWKQRSLHCIFLVAIAVTVPCICLTLLPPRHSSL